MSKKYELNNTIKTETKVGAIAKFLHEYFNGYSIQAFTTRNIVGDEMETIYEENGVTIDFCWDYDYIEIFGITEDEFDKLLEMKCIY